MGEGVFFAADVHHVFFHLLDLYTAAPDCCSYVLKGTVLVYVDEVNVSMKVWVTIVLMLDSATESVASSREAAHG